MGLEAASRKADARARVAPLAPQRYGVQFTLDQAGHDLLRHVQDLLGRQVVAGDIAEVMVRALKVYAAKLEKQRFAATEQPRARRCPRPGSRHIPAQVKRAVWERDGGQCTFVSESGHRCEARSELEYDHIQEFARGGEATVEGIRLRCRAHNQLTAERTFGAGFMREKREAARRDQAKVRAQRSAAASPREQESSVTAT
jgi:5-methylcytosine-specific restriction endonuclease McrA